MESLMVIVTVVSLVLAAGMAVVSWKLLRRRKPHIGSRRGTRGTRRC